MIKVQVHPLVCNHLLTVVQHFNAKHVIGCPECDRQFTTQDAMEKVSF